MLRQLTDIGYPRYLGMDGQCQSPPTRWSRASVLKCSPRLPCDTVFVQDQKGICKTRDKDTEIRCDESWWPSLTSSESRIRSVRSSVHKIWRKTWVYHHSYLEERTILIVVFLPQVFLVLPFLQRNEAQFDSERRFNKVAVEIMIQFCQREIMTWEQNPIWQHHYFVSSNLNLKQ